MLLATLHSRVIFIVAIVAMVTSLDYNVAENDFNSCPYPKFDGKNWTTIVEECLEILNVMITMFDNKWLLPLGTKNIEEPPLVTRIPGRVMDMFANDAPVVYRRKRSLEFGTVRPIHLGDRAVGEDVQNSTPNSSIHNQSDIVILSTFPDDPHKNLENGTSSSYTDGGDEHDWIASFENGTFHNDSEFFSVKILRPETAGNTTFESTAAVDVSQAIARTPVSASSWSIKSKLENGEYNNFTTIAALGTATGITVSTITTGNATITGTNLNNKTTDVPFPYSTKELIDRMRQKGMDDKTLEQMPQPVLLCPFTYEWPFNGHNSHAEQITNFLASNLGPLRKGRRKNAAQKTSIPDEIRRHLIFGTSQIIRHFQKENVLLSHVLFDRSLLKTPQIAFHLGQLASTKKSTTFCAVLENLNDICRPILRIKSCESIGILKNEEEKLAVLIESIEKLTPLSVKSTNDDRSVQNSKRKLDDAEIQASYIPPSVCMPESNEKRKKKKLKKKK